MPQRITVENYNPTWEKQFIKEKDIIKSILGNSVLEIYHIGSTAVRGLCAKPIIDIMPVVYDIAKVDLVATEFEKIGYEYLGEFGIKGRRYLRKGGDERTHQIHIFQKEDKLNIERHLAVRDYLRNHLEVAQRYGKLKKSLALQFPYDIDGYCDGKEIFMRDLEQSATAWYRNTIRQAQINDFDDIMNIWKSENIKAHSFISPNYWEENYPAVKNALPQAKVYVSVSKGEIMGFIGLNDNYIEGLFVKANQQNKGVGSALLDKMKALNSTLTLNVYKKNLNAVNFYLKNNFTITEEKIDERVNETEYTMQWKSV